MDIEQCIYKGIITGYEGSQVRVSRPDHEERVSAPLTVLQKFARDNKQWSIPAIGEEVLVIQLPNAGRKGVGEGFVIGGIYNKEDIPLEDDMAVISLKHKDGSYIRFDGQGNIELHATADIKITVGGQVKVDKG